MKPVALPATQANIKAIKFAAIYEDQRIYHN